MRQQVRQPIPHAPVAWQSDLIRNLFMADSRPPIATKTGTAIMRAAWSSRCAIEGVAAYMSNMSANDSSMRTIVRHIFAAILHTDAPRFQA